MQSVSVIILCYNVAARFISGGLSLPVSSTGFYPFPPDPPSAHSVPWQAGRAFPDKTYAGYRLLAVDGSDVNIARNPDLEFSVLT